MPLLRRNSAKKEEKEEEKREDGAAAQDDQGIESKTSSFFGRLGRRRSSAASRERPRGDGARDNESSSTTPVLPTAADAAGHAADSGDVTQDPSEARSESKSRSRRHSHHSKSRSRDRSTHEKHDGGPSGTVEEEHVEGALTKDDIQHLFLGAPHFMLEKGRRGRYFPQAFFPWNNHLDVADLQDRRYLKHEAFALSTLHSHLPIPDEVNWKPGMDHPVRREGLETGKRPMFDLGIYERPNMLSLGGREPGAVGMRFFLERFVADGLEDEKKEHADADNVQKLDDMQHMSASEALKALAHEEGDARVGKHAPHQDRVQIVKEGPKAWKRVGVRPISMRAVTERLELICSLRDEVVNAGWKVTVLNKFSSADLEKHLFNELLYPPNKLVSGHKERGLKVQIEALVKVLTTPGAWLDFSLPRERLVFGQVLNTRDHHLKDDHGITQGAKREWALVQLLLAIELVIRLDAALRLGVAQHSPELDVSSEEIHHFNKLRNLKVDWDCVVARRFLDLCYVKKLRDVGGTTVSGAAPTGAAAHEQHQHPPEHHLLDRFKKNVNIQTAGADNDENECIVLPRQPKSMVDGLLRFASGIGWSNVDQIEEGLRGKLTASEQARVKMLAQGTESVEHSHISRHALDQAVSVELRAASNDTVGGPLSHSWLSSLVIPGYICCDLLISALLENDPARPLSKLGQTAYPRSGFVLNSQSWWSQACIVGRALAPRTENRQSMGWIGLPSDVSPVDEKGQSYGEGWKVIKTQPAPQLREGKRIMDGDSLAKESSVLGMGHGRVLSTEFAMITDHVLDKNDLPTRRLDVTNVQLVLSKAKAEPESSLPTFNASVRFDVVREENGAEDTKTQVTLQLTHDIRFVAGHPCRLPHGHTSSSSTIPPPTAPATTAAEGQSQSAPHSHHQHPQHRPHEHLPAHPLHTSYRYTTKSISSLLFPPSSSPDIEIPNPTHKDSPVWIVDARGSDDDNTTSTTRNNKEVLVRAWCAQVGRDAIVARAGIVCLSCAIREAKALEVGVVIRVGVGGEAKGNI